jgi:uncharacterized SAM-binding protein YcdF (DUF218 family)
MSLPGLVVVLGSPNDDTGRICEMGQGRIALGLALYRERKAEGWKLLLTGGFGAHFNTTPLPHAHYARALMLESGVPPDDVVELAESRNTVDDALAARPIVERHGVPQLLVVSSDFHLARVEFIFRRVFPDRALAFAGAPYLASRPPEEQARLEAHEARELANLRARGESIVGGALHLDAWRKSAGPAGVRDNGTPPDRTD